MKNNLPLSTIFLLVTKLVSASDAALGAACMASVERYNYGCDNSNGVDYSCSCLNPVYMGSVLYCIENHAWAYHVEQTSRKTVNTVCIPASHRVLSARDFDIIYVNASKYIHSININERREQSLPFMVPSVILKGYLEASNVLIYNTDQTRYLRLALIAYIGIYILYLVVTNLVQRKLPRINKFIFSNNATKKIKKFIIKLPVMKFKNKRKIGLSLIVRLIPSRPITMVMVLYQILHIILLFINYRFISATNTVVKQHPMEYCKYLGDRAGALAIAQLPMAFLFAGRNRLLMYLLSQPQSIIRKIHVWISTGIGIDILIHGLCYGLLTSKYRTYSAHWSRIYLKLGTVAGILIIIQCVYSLLFIKIRSSSIFTTLHGIIAVVCVIGMGFHLDVVGDIDFLYIAISFWAASYINRWALILIGGFENKGIAKLFPGGVLELTINNSGKWRYKPGAYVYIHIAKWHSAWKLQPFYITEAPEEFEPAKLKAVTSVKGSITKSAWNYLRRHPHAYAEIKVLMEGPYGMHWPLYNYDTTVIICGGLGVSAGYGYASSLKRSGGSSKVVFVWLISNEWPLTWFSEQLGLLSDSTRCEVQIFVNDFYDGLDTRGGEEKQSVSGSLISLCPNYQSIPLQVSYERPNLRWIVFQNTMRSLGSISFLTCAPESVNRDIRSAVGDNLDTFNAIIDYYEEEFNL